MMAGAASAMETGSTNTCCVAHSHIAHATGQYARLRLCCGASPAITELHDIRCNVVQMRCRLAEARPLQWRQCAAGQHCLLRVGEDVEDEGANGLERRPRYG